jgi:hypothetical protein
MFLYFSMGILQNGWFIIKNPNEMMDDLDVPM